MAKVFPPHKLLTSQQVMALKESELVAKLKEMKGEISLILEDRDRLEREAKDSGDELMVRALGATVGTWPKVNGNWGDGRWSG